MRPILTYIFSASLLLFAFGASSQPLITTFSPGTVNASLGSTVSLQLKVQNFTDIQSLQFPITYNSAVLQFTSIDNATLPGFSAANYNASSGKVVISWFPDLGLYPNGYTATNNSSIFTVHFDVLASGSTTVNLESVSPGIEVIRNNDAITVDFGSGGTNVTAGGGGPGPLTGFHVIANTIEIPQGQTACMPVTVHDFDDIVSLAYAMHWDPSVLEYESTQAYNLPDLGGSNFNLFPAGSSTLLLSWFEQALTGVTRADGTSIYEVCFKAVGQAGSTDMIIIDGVGFPPGGGGAEVIDVNGGNVWLNDSGVSDTIFVVTAPPPPNAVTFAADSIMVATGETGCVDVMVQNFDDIISLQFGMTYDATKLQFNSFEFGANPMSLSNANFNANIPGEIKFTWFDQNALGVDLPDSTVIFSICYTAVGAADMVSPVTFTSLPGFAVEVVKEPGGEVIPLLLDGLVEITDFVQPIVDLMATPVSCNGNSNGTISASLIQGVNPMTYSWEGPGLPSPMMTTDSMITGLTAGTYSVTVTVAGGATNAATIMVDQPQVLFIQQALPENVSCFNGDDGSITVTPSGGTAPFSYEWAGPQYSNTTSSPTINNLSAGLYTVTITDDNGCTFVASPPIQLGQPSDININPSLVTVSPVTCFGLTNGTVALPNPSGGTPGFSFAWTGPNGFSAGTKNITNLAGGQYAVTITDSRSCTKTFQFNVTAPTDELEVAQNGLAEPVSCFGFNNGKAAIIVTGGTPPWVSSWRLGSPIGPVIDDGFNANGLVPGIYFPVVVDNNGCTATIASPITIDGPTEAIDISQSVDHVTCNGDGDGSISVTPSGGNGQPFSVQWSSGQSSTMIPNLDGGTYTVTVTDANGCTYSFDPIAVNEPGLIAISDSVITPQDGLVLGAVNLNTISGGTAPFTFSWTGPNGFTSNQEDLIDVPFGVYDLTITDDNGCTHVTSAEVLSTNVLIATSTNTTPSCNDDGCITFYVPAGAVAPVSIEMAGNTYFLDSDTFSICDLQSGTYQPTISDGAGSFHTLDPITVTQLAQALAGDSRTNPFDDFMNGSITLTPIPSNANLSYLWNNGDTTNMLSSLDSGTYVVTITNLSSGCVSINEYILVRTYQPFNCQVTLATEASCVNTDDGAISMFVTGADGPTYTFDWTGPNGFTDSTQNISGVFPGTYILTVTDESLVEWPCQPVILGSISELDITNVNELSNYNGFQVSGTTVCDGNASVVYTGSSGAVSFLWSNGGTAENNMDLCGGTYAVTVTDDLGCTAEWVDSLTVPASIIGSYEIASNYNGYDISCFENCDGRANISAVGGISPYTISWPSGQVDQNVPVGGISQANQLCAGEYEVTITDANGVTATSMITVSEPTLLELEFDDVVPSSFSACDGEVLASAPAGVGTVLFTWSTANGQAGNDPLAENLCSGDYITYIIEDENGCTAVGRHLVPYPADGCLQVRPVITPGQADGNNDYTLVTCIEDHPNNTFEVYNRWGQLVYETTGYNNGDRRWEGLTASGQLLPDGVYFYVLKYVDDNGKDQMLKGYINLLR